MCQQVNTHELLREIFFNIFINSMALFEKFHYFFFLFQDNLSTLQDSVEKLKLDLQKQGTDLGG